MATKTKPKHRTIEVGMTVVSTHEAGGLDWEVMSIVDQAVVIKWTDRKYLEVFRTRVERAGTFWDRYALCPN